MAFKTKAPDQVIHPVEAAQDRALATSGRPDEGRDLILLDRDDGVPDGLKGPVIQFFDVAIDHYVRGPRPSVLRPRAVLLG